MDIINLFIFINLYLYLYYIYLFIFIYNRYKEIWVLFAGRRTEYLLALSMKISLM